MKACKHNASKWKTGQILIKTAQAYTYAINAKNALKTKIKPYKHNITFSDAVQGKMRFILKYPNKADGIRQSLKKRKNRAQVVSLPPVMNRIAVCLL